MMYHVSVGAAHNTFYFYIDISLPPKIRKRGRPKGHDLTVIGLPKKKTKSADHKLTSFLMLHSCLKEKSK